MLLETVRKKSSKAFPATTSICVLGCNKGSRFGLACPAHHPILWRKVIEINGFRVMPGPLVAGRETRSAAERESEKPPARGIRVLFSLRWDDRLRVRCHRVLRALLCPVPVETRSPFRAPRSCQNRSPRVKPAAAFLRAFGASKASRVGIVALEV